MAREIILDTETTGLDHRTGHRLIEIACVELNDLLPTGRSFHRYIHPEREIDVDAEKVHGISLAMLEGAPRFGEPEVVEEFLTFVGDAVLVAHNAGFDRGFVNAELGRLNRASLPDTQWIDTLALAQARFPGMYNSLDALCKRFKISLAEREKHGALVDAKLLANVYLELRGGRERGLEFAEDSRESRTVVVGPTAGYGARPRPLAPRATEAELARHAAFVRDALGEGGLWATYQD